MTPGTTSRAVAARALARVALQGVSLRVTIADAAPLLPDSRDRALLSASLFAATRWWLRLDAALSHLIDKPLPSKASEIRALLIIALAQLSVLNMPDYAVVAACVDAARALGQPRYAALVNAILRRFLRERSALDIKLDQDVVTRYAHPRWLIDAIRHDWPGQAEAIFTANNCEAALTLRINRRRCARETLHTRFTAAGIAAQMHPLCEDALVLEESTDVTTLPGYDEGLFSVQDGAAQRVIDLLDLQSHQTVLDACAAPGGKASHILERADVSLLALDRDASRLPRIHANLHRLGLTATVRAADASTPATWWDGRPFERILLDAPCSATGIIRRQPDIKLHRRANDIASMVIEQGQLLTALWPMLAPGGRLVYATCSVLRAENAAVLTTFLDRRKDARPLPVPENYGTSADIGRQHFPGADGMDGFYYAVMEKTT